MKTKVLGLLAMILTLSACGARFNDEFTESPIPPVATIASPTSAQGTWGEEGQWSTTADGYPVW